MKLQRCCNLKVSPGTGMPKIFWRISIAIRESSIELDGSRANPTMSQQIDKHPSLSAFTAPLYSSNSWIWKRWGREAAATGKMGEHFTRWATNYIYMQLIIQWIFVTSSKHWYSAAFIYTMILGHAPLSEKLRLGLPSKDDPSWHNIYKDTKGKKLCPWINLRHILRYKYEQESKLQDNYFRLHPISLPQLSILGWQSSGCNDRS